MTPLYTRPGANLRHEDCLLIYECQDHKRRFYQCVETIALDINIGPKTGLVPIATPPPWRPTSKQSSMTEAMFGAYRDMVELIELPFFRGFGYGLDRRQCIRSPFRDREAR